MATIVYCLVLLFATSVAVPFKPRSRRGIDCNRSGCYYLTEDEKTDEVRYPDNFTDTLLRVLPDIIGSQREMVLLLNNTQISQDKVLDTVEHRLEGMSHRLEGMDISLNKTAGILEKLEVSIEKINSRLETENQQIQNLTNTMTQLMGKVVDLLERKTFATPGSTELPPVKDCQDLADRGINSSGTYVITPPNGRGSLEVYCDFIDDEGWTVFLNRYDGSVDFYRNWTEYENGFGDLNGEHWLGLKNVRRLISDGNTWALRVDLEAFDGDSAYAVYNVFSIRGAACNYLLSVGEYCGTAGDSLTLTAELHNGRQFTTFDRDNDRASDDNCATYYSAAWWYDSCHRAHLTGTYLGPQGSNDARGMVWYTFKQFQSLKTSQMKIRRVR